MPLDNLANIAEIVAAALVIVSLIYVGIQIRQNTAATHAATGQAWFNTFDGISRMPKSSNSAPIWINLSRPLRSFIFNRRRADWTPDYGRFRATQ
jgi:hypothetical protein